MSGMAGRAQLAEELPEAPALQSGVEGVIAPHCGTWGLLASCGKQWKVGFLLKRCRETL